MSLHIVQAIQITVEELIQLIIDYEKPFKCEHTRHLHLYKLRRCRKQIMQWLRKGYYSHNHDTDLYWLDVYKLFQKAIKVTPNELEEERDYLDGCRLYLQSKIFKCSFEEKLNFLVVA